jgi:acyl-homoserine-lactone acylase
MSRFVPRAMTAVLAIAATAGAADAYAQAKYSAEVRRTSFGIAHIKANDFGSAGYGVGHAFAQDNFCMMADEFVTVRGERSRHFGGTGRRPMGSTTLQRRLLRLLTATRPLRPAWQHEARGAGRLPGWVAATTATSRHRAANLPAPCTGAAWVRPIDDRHRAPCARYALQASARQPCLLAFNTLRLPPRRR